MTASALRAIVGYLKRLTRCAVTQARCQERWKHLRIVGRNLKLRLLHRSWKRRRHGTLTVTTSSSTECCPPPRSHRRCYSPEQLNDSFEADCLCEIAIVVSADFLCDECVQ